ncbi:MAG: 3-ketoacyl-ACP reductase [Clostridia bacterium]
MKKTAIVTGSGRVNGIGFAVALELGEQGHNIVLVGVSEPSKAQPALDSLKEKNIEAIYVQANIAIKEDRENLVNTTIEKFGEIDVLVNNAGVAPLVRADLLEMTEESFDRVISINTKGNMFLTQLVAKQMIKQEIKGKKRGSIVNISSCSSTVSSISRGEYCVSKAGVSMLTMLYADRLASEQIYVYEVRPGVIATDMTATVEEKYTKMFNEGAFPIARWGLPEDVAGAVGAFCSDKFTYSTGNYIDIDGGFHIKRL